MVEQHIATTSPRQLDSDLDAASGERRCNGHGAAVRRTLHWADQAAQRGDYKEALEWLTVVEAIGDRLPKHYVVKRELWRASQPLQSRCKGTTGSLAAATGG